MKTMKMFARITPSGTACSETALCFDCFNQKNRSIVDKQASEDACTWEDCSENEYLECQSCGKPAPAYTAAHHDMPSTVPKRYKDGHCRLCGEKMPVGEEMFYYHGYSGNCPKDAAEKPAEEGR